MKILVIDDDEMVRDSLATVLRDRGYDVFTARDGYRAMAVFASARPDMILTDILMPEQEGIETIRRIRLENPEIKIIAMSGGGRIIGIDVLDLAKKLGADEVLAKPFDPEHLLRRISALAPEA
jgi:DNA-binding response OmpR family regulator